MPDSSLDASSRTPILGVPVNTVDLVAAIAAISTWIKARTPHGVFLASARAVTLCRDDTDLRKIFNRAGLVLPGDRSLAQVLRWKGSKSAACIPGPDLLLAACEAGLSSGWRHYFYGGSPEASKKLIETLTARFPGLVVAGTETPPFRPPTEKEDLETIRRIRAANPDIVWVGLGCPRQERWMAGHLTKLGVPVLVGVGAAFDFISGIKPQAPRWVQRSGMEWFHRLLSEPRRLWKRYILGYPRFVVLAAGELIFKKKEKS